MAEYVSNAVQLVQPNQVAILSDSIPCNKGYVFHRNESGNLILRGITPNCFARYEVTFNGNIGIPSTGTVDAISVALAINGEALPTSQAIVTPAAVTAAVPSDLNYFNVTSTAIITVPKGCCLDVTVENTSTQAINVRNANVTVSRIA